MLTRVRSSSCAHNVFVVGTFQVWCWSVVRWNFWAATRRIIRKTNDRQATCLSDCTDGPHQHVYSFLYLYVLPTAMTAMLLYLAKAAIFAIAF
jgi:hypothetical protein